MLQYAERKMDENKYLKDYLLFFAHEADFNITDVNIEKHREMMPDSVKDMLMHDKDLPEDMKEKLRNQPYIERKNAIFEHSVTNERGEERYNLSDDQQSDGTKRTLGIEAAIQSCIENNRLLPIDEIERSLHPTLLEFILKEYLSKKSESQLLVTTHYDVLLNCVDKFIRKDSVWFTEKRPDGSTKIYPLTSVKGINKMRNLQKRYSEGNLVNARPRISIY